jgi:hypothetical protein
MGGVAYSGAFGRKLLRLDQYLKSTSPKAEENVPNPKLFLPAPICARRNQIAAQLALLPTKHLRRKRRANDKNDRQCRYIADVRRPRVAVPDSLE